MSDDERDALQDEADLVDDLEPVPARAEDRRGASSRPVRTWRITRTGLADAITDRRDRQERVDQPPERVTRRLAPGEKALIVTREHWIVVLRPIAAAVAGLVAAIAAASVLGPAVPMLGGILLIGWLLLLLWAMDRVAEHYVHYIVITQKRILRIRGLVSNVAMLPIGRVTDVGYNRSFLGWLLGYGRFDVESAGQVQALRTLDFVPRPDHVHHVLTNAMYATE